MCCKAPRRHPQQNKAGTGERRTLNIHSGLRDGERGEGGREGGGGSFTRVGGVYCDENLFILLV